MGARKRLLRLRLAQRFRADIADVVAGQVQHLQRPGFRRLAGRPPGLALNVDPRSSNVGRSVLGRIEADFCNQLFNFAEVKKIERR